MKRRTGRTKHTGLMLTVLVLVLLLSAGTASAQDFTLEASLSENRVWIGEQFTLQIEVRSPDLRNVEPPRLPQLEGIRVLNAVPSRSQSISVINGVTKTVTSYHFTLIARETGTKTIPPITVVIDGEEHRTREMQVEILRQQGVQPEPDERRPDIFVQVELDDKEPVVGQQVVASLVIYFKDGIEVASYRPTPGWRTDGFWKEELEENEQPRSESVLLGNIRYRRATLLRYALFPTRAGELLLDPFEITLGIRTQPTRFDPFGSVFGGLGTNHRRVTLESEALPVRVRPLDPPPSGRVTLGAVGEFEVERRASVTKAYIGESIELITTIRGNGNIPLIQKPSWSYPQGFELYSPQEVTDLQKVGTEIRGSRTFTDRLVPRIAGHFTLPAERVTWFNPDSRRYEEQFLPEITLEIIRDPLTPADERTGVLPLRIQTGLTLWERGDGGSAWIWIFWIGLILPAAALAVAWNRRSVLRRLEEDSAFARAHYAWDRAEEHLMQAGNEASGENPRQAYHSIWKAITGYITDRMGLPEAGLSSRELTDKVREEGGSNELASELQQLLDKCTSISYAPPGSRQDVEKDVRRASDLLNQLRKSL